MKKGRRIEDEHWTIGGSDAWSRGGSGGEEVIRWRKGAGRHHLDSGAGAAWRLGVVREEGPASRGHVEKGRRLLQRASGGWSRLAVDLLLYRHRCGHWGFAKEGPAVDLVLRE
jgi:hypothetical protein